MDLSKYYEEICKQPIMKKDQEVALFKELHDSNTVEKRKEKIRDEIIRSNLRFVFKTAKAYSKNDPESFSELIAAGNEGLLVGLAKYNPSSGVRFLSYAGWWVVQRILKEMSRMRIVSLPIWKQQLAARIQKLKDANEKITLSEVKRAFPDIPEKDIEDLFSTKYLTYYIEDISEDSSFEINPIEEEVEKKIGNEELTSKVMSLQEPYRTIVTFTFGLNNGEEINETTLARRLNVTKENFRKLKEEALEQLRKAYGI